MPSWNRIIEYPAIQRERSRGSTTARCADIVWGMLYADDVVMVSESEEGFAKMMTVIVTVYEAPEITVSQM